MYRRTHIASLSVVLATTLGASGCFNPVNNSAEPNSSPKSGEALSSGIELSGMDPEQRPQDDFHRYANGVWLREMVIPEQYSSYSPFVILREAAEKNQLAIIEELAAQAPTTGSNEQKIGDFYASFMDTDAIEAAGATPLQQELAAVDAVQTPEQLFALFADFMRRGISAPLAIGVSQDLKQSDRYTVYMGQSGLGLPNRDYYLETDNPRFQRILAAYPDYIVRIFTLAGISQPQQKAAAIVDLETQIATHQWSVIDNRNPEKIYNPTTPEQLRQLAPGLNWSDYLNGTGIASVPQVIVAQPSYLQGLDELVGEVPLSTWKAYLQLRILSDYAPYLSKDYVDTHFDFYGRVISGKQKQLQRWRRGIAATNGALGEAIGQIYVEKYFPPEAKARMMELVDNLLAEFRDRIDKLEWMGPATKQAAQQKLAKFNVKIGYPDKWRDYSALTVSRQDIISNIRASQTFEYNYELAKLDKPIDRDEWHMTPQTVNAYYHPAMNEIVFPAAILQPPFFHMDADDAVNYGAIGMVIGHEISHGFDDQGSKFDGDGNLRNWWTDEDRQRFEERTRKLVAQYDRYEPIPGMHIKGELTLGENIGDLSGLTVAYHAYQRSLDGQPAPVIEGFSGDQRFFLGLAQAWRAKYREEALANMITTDPHSPPRYRVNGVVVNMDEFYRAFDVEDGDKLYLPPEQRVHIW